MSNYNFLPDETGLIEGKTQQTVYSGEICYSNRCNVDHIYADSTGRIFGIAETDGCPLHCVVYLGDNEWSANVFEAESLAIEANAYRKR